MNQTDKKQRVRNIVIRTNDARSVIFDLLTDLCNYSYEAGMEEVSYRIEDALDAVLDEISGKAPEAPEAPSFRSQRAEPAVRRAQPGHLFVHRPHDAGRLVA